VIKILDRAKRFVAKDAKTSLRYAAIMFVCYFTLSFELWQSHTKAVVLLSVISALSAPLVRISFFLIAYRGEFDEAYEEFTKS
jgi:hypothetical protein